MIEHYGGVHRSAGPIFLQVDPQHGYTCDGAPLTQEQKVCLEVCFGTAVVIEDFLETQDIKVGVETIVNKLWPKIPLIKAHAEGIFKLMWKGKKLGFLTKPKPRYDSYKIISDESYDWFQWFRTNHWVKTYKSKILGGRTPSDEDVRLKDEQEAADPEKKRVYIGASAEVSLALHAISPFSPQEPYPEVFFRKQPVWLRLMISLTLFALANLVHDGGVSIEEVDGKVVLEYKEIEPVETPAVGEDVAKFFD